MDHTFKTIVIVDDNTAILTALRICLATEYERIVTLSSPDTLVTTLAKENGVTGSRIMGGGFGGCTINLVKDDIYDKFVEDVTAKFTAKYGHAPEIYPVVISEGSHKVC